MTIEGLPSDVVQADVGLGSVSIHCDAGTYPLDAIYGAAYIFIDRCYVFIDKPSESKYRVTLSAKKTPVEEATLRQLVGEFANELLACAWRHQITQDNKAIIEAVTAQALSSAMGPPSLDELASFDFSEEPFEDPLGIALSWEEKYKKSKDGAGDKPAGDKAESAPAAPAEASAEKPAAEATANTEVKAP